MTEMREERDRVRLSAFEQGSEYEKQRIDTVFIVIDYRMINLIKERSIISANSR